MTERVKARCSACGQFYSVRPDKLGRRLKCSKCASTFTLTADATPAVSTKVPGVAEASAWHVVADNATKGPFTVAQIISLLEEMQLAPNTLAWKAGMEDWTPLASLPDFIDAVSSTNPPTSPPKRASASPTPTHVASAAPLAATKGRTGLAGLFASKCATCGKRMSMYERAARNGKCAKCLIVDVGMVNASNESYLYSQAATYKGGLPGHPEQAKQPGFAYVYQTGLYFFDHQIQWTITYPQVVRAELDTFQLGGTRAMFAGIAAVALKQVRNTLAVTFLDASSLEQTGRFQIHGSASILGEEAMAHEFLNHLLGFKSQFASRVAASRPESSEDVVEQLRKLDRLRDDGIIRPDEYERKRALLIDRL